MPADNLTFLIGFAAVFGALGWYLWHLEREVTRLGQRLDDARAGAPPVRQQHSEAAGFLAGDALSGDGAGARAGADRGAFRAQEGAHIERDAGSLPHAPTPTARQRGSGAAQTREASHIERDAGSLPHAPTPTAHRQERERGGSMGDDGEGAADEEDAARAKRERREDRT